MFRLGSAPLWKCHICPRLGAGVCLHRQRQNLLIEFTNEFGVADMGGQNISHVLAHRDAALRGFTFDDLVDDAIGPRHDLRAIALVCAAPLGHGANSASDRVCYLITTRGLARTTCETVDDG